MWLFFLFGNCLTTFIFADTFLFFCFTFSCFHDATDMFLPTYQVNLSGKKKLSWTCIAASSWLWSTRWTSWHKEVTPSTGRMTAFFWKGLLTKSIGANISLWGPVLSSEFASPAPQDREALAALGITYGQELTTSVVLGDAWYAWRTACIAAFCWWALTENLFVMARTQGIPRALASSSRSESAGCCCDAFEWLYRGILWDRLCTRTIKSVFLLRSRIPIQSSSLKQEASVWRSCNGKIRGISWNIIIAEPNH